MCRTKDFAVKLCTEWLKRSSVSYNSSKGYLVKSFQHENEKIVIEVSNGKDDFVFELKATTKESNKDSTGSSNGNKFYVEDDNIFIEFKNVDIKEYYLLQVKQVSVTELQLILEALAYNHSWAVERSDRDDSVQQKHFFVTVNQKLILDIIYKLSQHLNVDINILKKEIEELLGTFAEAVTLVEENLYANGSIFQKKVFFKSNQAQRAECALVAIEEGKPVPIVYDMLLTLFYFTDQRKRQQHFHEMTECYYRDLKKNLQHTDLSLILPLTKYENQIKLFTPYAKLEVAFRSVQQIVDELRTNEDDILEKVLQFLDTNHKERELLLEILSEICKHVLYPNLTIEDCYKILRNVTGTSDYEIEDYKLIPLRNLLGVVGTYFKLQIEYQHRRVKHLLNLFVKCLPKPNESYNEFVSPMAEKEEFIYKTLIPELISLGLEAITDFLPKCYFARSKDMFVFEDMSVLNYVAADPKHPFSYSEMSLIVKQLAKFHACSLLLEEILTRKTGEKFRLDNKFGKYLKEVVYIDDSPLHRKAHEVGVRATIDYIFDLFPDVPRRLTMEEFKQKGDLCFDQMLQKLKKSDKYRNVICHGDFWTTNILLQNGENRETVGCCFVDFQLTRYCPPTQDLMILFYQNTDKATRTKYMSKLTDEYYAELSGIFEKYSFNLNEIYPYDLFMECCSYMKSQGICQALLCYQNSLCRDKVQEELKDPQAAMQYLMVDRTEILGKMMEDDEVKLRFREVVEDLYDICENGEV